VAKDDPVIQAWAAGYEDYLPGGSVDQTWRTPEKALGPAQGTAYDIVCLGRGGRITLVFDPPLENGDGFDLAVFENSFDDRFLELAFVEVSSNGQDFARFPAVSLTSSPAAGFGGLDATDVHNLAGKYRQGFGTPFDFQELSASALVQAGSLDLNAVSHVRIIDIPGNGLALDSENRPIYDPYPTTGSAGFDLDAAAGMHPALQPRDNEPPQAPELLAPLGQTTDTSPVLRTGAFDDPDLPLDSHSSTRWQIALDGDFEHCILDLASTRNLLSLNTPDLVLAPDAGYFWRARHHDRSGAASDWAVAGFQTPADSADLDANGLPDSQELTAADSEIDVNADGIPDWSQAGGGYAPLKGQDCVLALEAPTAFIRARLSATEALAPSDDRPETVPGCAVSFALAVDEVENAQVEVTVRFDADIPSGAQWLRHSVQTGWSAFPAVLSGRAAVLTLQDGGPGDADGVANGVIVSHGALAYETGSPPAEASSGIGGGGCTAGATADWLLALRPIAFLAGRRAFACR